MVYKLLIYICASEFCKSLFQRNIFIGKNFLKKTVVVQQNIELIKTNQSQVYEHLNKFKYQLKFNKNI
jgi:hypothetical protein